MGKIHAAATTGPQSGPLPASSIPETLRVPELPGQRRTGQASTVAGREYHRRPYHGNGDGNWSYKIPEAGSVRQYIQWQRDRDCCARR